MRLRSARASLTSAPSFAHGANSPPWCVYRYPSHTGIGPDVLVENVPYGVPAREVFIAEYLKKAGYKTHAVGKWHLGKCDDRYASYDPRPSSACRHHPPTVLGPDCCSLDPATNTFFYLHRCSPGTRRPIVGLIATWAILTAHNPTGITRGIIETRLLSMLLG